MRYVAQVLVVVLMALPTVGVAGMRPLCEGWLYDVNEQFTLTKQTLRGETPPLREMLGQWVQRGRRFWQADEERMRTLENSWRNTHLTRSFEHWRPKFELELNKQNLLADKESDPGEFWLNRDPLFERNPALGRLEIPVSYQLAVAPVETVYNVEAAVDPIQRRLYLPMNVLWRPLSYTEILDVVHEVVHIHLFEKQDERKFPLFMSKYKVNSAALPAGSAALEFYADAFSSQEIITRLVTTLRRLDDICEGRPADADSRLELRWDLNIALDVSDFYLHYILPRILTALTLSLDHPAVWTAKSGYLVMEHFTPELSAVFPLRPWSMGWVQGDPRAASRAAVGALQTERAVLLNVHSTLERISVQVTPNSNLRAVCGERPALRRLVQKVGLDPERYLH